jgi:hypothetical protein
MLYRAETFGRAIPLLASRIGAIDFDQHRIIDIRAERSFADGLVRDMGRADGLLEHRDERALDSCRCARRVEKICRCASLQSRWDIRDIVIGDAVFSFVWDVDVTRQPPYRAFSDCSVARLAGLSLCLPDQISCLKSPPLRGAFYLNDRARHKGANKASRGRSIEKLWSTLIHSLSNTELIYTDSARGPLQVSNCRVFLAQFERHR